MFSNNRMVSVRQMKRLLVLDLFSGTSLILPMAVGRISGSSGIFAIALGGVLAGIFAVFILSVGRCYTGAYPQFCQDMLGKWGAKIIMLMYALKYFVSAVLLLAVFAQIVNHTFLTDVPKVILGGALLVLCGYCVSKGLETRAHLGEMLVYLVIIPVILIIVLALPQMHVEWLWPIETLDTGTGGPDSASGMPGFVWACVLVFSCFCVLEWLLFLRPNVRKSSRVRSQTLWSIVWPVLLNLLILIVCIGVFSVEGMNAESWPTVTLMQIVRFPGGFLSRQDGLMLAFWMVGMFTIISGCFYYGSESLKAVIPCYKKTWMLIFPGAGILLAFLGIYTRDATRMYLRYMLFIYMPLSLLLPMLLKIVFVFRRRTGRGANSGGHKAVRSLCLAFILTLVLPMLTGCQGMVAIEDRNFVMCMGVDASDDGLSVSFGFPDLKALTGDGDNIHYPAAALSGENMDSIARQYGDRSNKRLDYGQLQMIIFGREMMENTEKMAQVLDYIKEHQEFTRTVFVCMAQEKARDIVALDESVNGSIGVYLKQLFENNQTGYQLTVGDLIIGMSRPDKMQEIAVVEAGEDMPVVVDMETFMGYSIE